MSTLETIFLIASLAGVVLTIIFAIVASISSRRNSMSAGEGKSGTMAGEESGGGLFLTAKILTVLSLVFITITIVFRAIQTGHGPFSNMYEFALAFAWGIIIMGIIFEWRYKTATVRNMGLIVALLLLIFATVNNAKPEPLVPALTTECSFVCACCFGSSCIWCFYNRFWCRYTIPDPESPQFTLAA